jgi:hypothetical protein
VISEGLTVLEADGASGLLSVAFKEGAHVVYFQALRGPAVNEYYRNNDPDAPEFEVDARFQDANGDVFMTQMGGDTFLDPTWKNAGAEPLTAPDSARRQQDFRLAWKIADALIVRADLPTTLRPLQLAADHLSHTMTEADLNVTKADIDAKITPLPGDLKAGDVGYGSGAHYHHRYDIRDKCIALCLGRHSAVRWYSFYSANTGYSYMGYSCNHGACAHGDSSMGTKCTRTSGARSNSKPPFQNGYNGACSTPYDWNSGSGKHNCNDDSTVQMYNVHYNSTYSTTGGCCGSSSINDYSPNCL